MIVAFHFLADADAYGATWVLSINETIFKWLDTRDHHAHAVIATGDLLLPFDLTAEGKEAVLQSLIGYHPRNWRTIQSEEFADLLFSKRIYVVAIEGLGALPTETNYPLPICGRRRALALPQVRGGRRSRRKGCRNR